jgi:hypothetical protein
MRSGSLRGGQALTLHNCDIMTRIAASLVLIYSGVIHASDPLFKPTLVRTDGKLVPAVELIDSIAKAAGIPIDRSAVPSAAKVTLKPETPFWEALQTIADETGCRMVLEGNGDRIALVRNDRFPRPVPAITGPFRVAVKSVHAKNDFETGRSSIDVQLELHWEPRIAVFRVATLSASTTDHQGTADAGKVSVRGARQPLNIRFPGISRTTEKWSSLTGSVTVTAAEKMLRVSFDELSAKQPTKTVEKVMVTLVKWEKIDDLWEARVELTYPPGMPTFESFEAECWLRDNACRLVSPDRSKSFDAKDQLVRITATGAMIDYRFPEDKAKGLLPGKGWRLEVDTPSPLLEFAVPFELKNIPLP